MKRRLSRIVVGAAIALVTFVPAAAQAGFIGQTVEATALFPDLAGSGVIGGPVQAVVGPGAEFLDGQFGAFFGPTFDFDDATITITHAQTGHSGPVAFNGYRFTDILAGIPMITGVSVASDSTGFFSGDPARIFFDAENIWVNFESLSFAGQNNPTIVLNVQFDQGIPEPGTLALLGLGLAGLAAARRRRQ